MTHPSIRSGALERAIREHGRPQQPAARDLPDWCTASVTYDVDEVLLLEVLCWRPSRSPLEVVGHLADQLSALGWREQAHGPLPWHRPDGVMCSGCWVTWTRGGDRG